MAETNWLDHDEQRAWRGFLLASRLVMDQLNRELQDGHDMSLTDYGILVRLSEEPAHRLRMSELAGSSGLSKSRLSHQMKRMEARGLTSRSSCEDDARGTFAELTEAGLAALEAAAPTHVRGVREHLLDHINREDIAEVSRWTERIVRHLDVDNKCGPVLPALV